MIVLPRRPGLARAYRAVAASLLAAVALGATVPGTASAAEVIPGSAGTDTSVAPTASQTTVSGRGRFSELKVSVNQTRNLANQAISVTWTGGDADHRLRRGCRHHRGALPPDVPVLG